MGSSLGESEGGERDQLGAGRVAENPRPPDQRASRDVGTRRSRLPAAGAIDKVSAVEGEGDRSDLQEQKQQLHGSDEHQQHQQCGLLQQDGRWGQDGEHYDYAKRDQGCGALGALDGHGVGRR
jgi:hypothetical protein